MIVKSGADCYQFGPFLLDPTEHVLLRADQPVRIPRKDFELLVALVQRPGSLVRKEALLQLLWPDAIVEEGNLTKHLSTLRRTLADSEDFRFIETVPGIGVRFVAPVAVVTGEAREVSSTPKPLTGSPGRPTPARRRRDFLAWTVAGIAVLVAGGLAVRL